MSSRREVEDQGYLKVADLRQFGNHPRRAEFASFSMNSSSDEAGVFDELSLANKRRRLLNDEEEDRECDSPLFGRTLGGQENDSSAVEAFMEREPEGEIGGGLEAASLLDASLLGTERGIASIAPDPIAEVNLFTSDALRGKNDA